MQGSRAAVPGIAPQIKKIAPGARYSWAMATIEKRENLKGSPSYRVVWYHKGVRQRPVTVKSIREADEWKRLIEMHEGDQKKAARDLAKVKHIGPTMREVYEHWIERHSGTPKTLDEYKSYWQNHLGPAIGDMPVSMVEADDIRAIVKSMQEKDLAPKTIRNVVGSLSPMLSHAVDYNWIKATPWRDKILPRAKAKKVERDKFLSRDEVELIISGLRNPAPYRIMLATGLRPSELCALDVSDVYLDAKHPNLRVTKAVKQSRADGDYIGEPKSPRSIRTIGLPPSAVEVLRPLIEGRAPGDPLFMQASGPRKDAERVRLRRRRFYQTWQRRVEKLRKSPGKDEKGSPLSPPLTKKPELYSLRHTHASWMINAGMQIWQLSRHLGHSSVTVTETHYLHLMPDAHFAAASYAAAALGETSTDSPAVIES